MHARTKSEKAGRRVGRRVVALVVTGSLVSACAPVLPPSYPYAGSAYPMGQPYRATASGGYPGAPAPYTYRQPVQPVGGAPASQQQVSGSNIENDALFGGVGYVAGRQFSQTAPALVDTTTVGVAETETAVATGMRAVPVVVSTTEGATAAAVTTAEVGAAEGAADVAVAAAVGDFIVPALLVGGALYVGYRVYCDAHPSDCSQ
jgi:hypothetical protein